VAIKVEIVAKVKHCLGLGEPQSAVN